MWGKFSFRIKITVIFSVALIVLTVSLTVLSLMNVQQNIANPMARSLVVFRDAGPIVVNNNEILQGFLTEEQLEELANLLPERTFIVEETGVYTVDDLQEHLNATQRNFSQSSLWIAGVVIILGTLGAYWVAGVVVRPIKALSTSVGKIEADQLDVNLPLPKSHDEISQLTASFNGMLGKLHRSFESKQLFAQNAAHELKTPLAIIRAHMEALEMDENPTATDYEEVFGEVKQNTERMIGLVEGLLAMGKSPAEADMTELDGQELFVDIFEDLDEAIHAKRLDVQILGDTTIKGEKTLLGQAFFNLIHNAVRYNVEGGSIAVTLSENQITIDDTGIGIPPEAIEQIFDPFYCVDSSRSKKPGGSGLGLAIAKNILDAHGMSIDLTSEVGTGTRITIYI